MDRLLTMKELAEVLRVSYSVIRQWPSHRLPPRVIIPGSPRMVRFRESEVQKWLSRSEPVERQHPVKIGRPRRGLSI
ncbi:helix-turn-helix domain-containing protein [Acidithiobacillus caldus]|nr:helix-turn-helix domain-containing protein [Acidithiobacillus caldus]